MWRDSEGSRTTFARQRLLPYLGLWVISVVMGGAVCLNAMSFDAMRVRAALDSGTRLWHLLVIKNLALASLVAPLGFLLSALLAWRASDLGAFFKACALMWLLLTVFAVALSQQPKIHRALLREITDYNSNAEARAFAEVGSRSAATRADPVGATVREPCG